MISATRSIPGEIVGLFTHHNGRIVGAAFTRGLVWALLMATAAVASPDPMLSVDWPSYLARHDLVWTKLRDMSGGKGGNCAFMGNGSIGANVRYDRSTNSILWILNRMDTYARVDDKRQKVERHEIGILTIPLSGDVQDGWMRQDLWNARINAHIETEQGAIDLSTCTHAEKDVLLIEIKSEQEGVYGPISFQPVDSSTVVSEGGGVQLCHSL